MNSKTRQYDRSLLRALLIPLVNQWGREEILDVLHEMEEQSRTVGAEGRGSHRHIYTTADRKRSQSTSKPSAVLIAERADVPNEKKVLLINLAAKFEHKSFLPTISDVRNFLEMRGEDARNVKQRSDAFRRVIKTIKNIPLENLEQMVRSNSHSGPSELGPLSDAIKAASASGRFHASDQKLVTDGNKSEPNAFDQISFKLDTEKNSATVASQSDTSLPIPVADTGNRTEAPSRGSDPITNKRSSNLDGGQVGKKNYPRGSKR